MNNTSPTPPSKSLWRKLGDWFNTTWQYVSNGVWADSRNNIGVNIIKTVNLSVRSFLNADIQTRAGYLTYQTLLAIVPALALLFAIGRGFGFQNVLKSQLFANFPAQQKALEAAFSFVDSYLAQSSEGIFVGVGLLFLLWTLISLISNVEESFNKIWGVRQGRTLWRKITDYTAIFLILPVIMICASGLMVFMSTTLDNLVPAIADSILMRLLLDSASVVLIWLFFAGTYLLIPNAKVKFSSALLAGVFAGTGYVVLQWLFVSGQLYVTKYNAIYGSFSFLPLLLIWLQFVWMITLSGGVICFSTQNISQYTFSNELPNISFDYELTLTLAVASVATRNYAANLPLPSIANISEKYGMPITVVNNAVGKLINCGILMRVESTKHDNTPFTLAPAINPTQLTVGMVIDRLATHGSGDFLHKFNTEFSPLIANLQALRQSLISEASKQLLVNLNKQVKK